MRDSIRQAVFDYIKENHPMPEHIALLASHAKLDLVNGPLYLDENGQSCPCFEDGATKFDFISACTTINDWADCLPGTLYVEIGSEYVTDKEPNAWIEVCDCVKPCGGADDDCPFCHGVGKVLRQPEEYYIIEDITRLVFGELAEYF